MLSTTQVVSVRIISVLVLAATAACAGAPAAGLLNKTRELLADGDFKQGAGEWKLVDCKIVRFKERGYPLRHVVLLGSQPPAAAEPTSMLDDGTDTDLDPLLAEALGGGEEKKPKAQKPRTSSLSRSVHLVSGNLYRLCFSARGKGDEVALRALLRGPDGREQRQLKMPRSLSSKWVQVTSEFSVEATGDTVVAIELASVPGRGPAAWISDVSITETAMPTQIPITRGAGFNNDPVMTAGLNGSVYCAVISFVDGKDVVRLFLVPEVAVKTPRVKLISEIALPGCRDVWRLALASTGADAWLAASCEVNDNWDIYLWPVGPDGAGGRIRVTDDPATDTNPSLAVLKDRVVVAWESNRYRNRRIMIADVVDGKPSEPQAVSSADFAGYSPCIAADWDGRNAWLVWESFRAGNYDIYGARHDGQGWTTEHLLSDDPRIEHRPVVAFAPDGKAWMAWEAMEYLYQRYRTGRAAQQRIVLARLDDDGLKMPRDVFDLYADLSSYPAIACDPAGRVWVSARTGGNPGLRAFCGTNWTGEIALSCTRLSHSRRSQPCPLAVSGGKLLIGAAYEAGRPNHYYGKPFESRWGPHEMNVLLVGLDLADMPQPSRPELVPLDLPDTEFDMAAQRAKYGEDRTGKTMEYGGRKLYLLWGQFHEHSDFSRCARGRDMSAQDSYGYHRDTHKADFCAVTDHGYDMSEVIWHYLSKTARVQHDPGHFTTFLGLEWTAQFGNGGHRNLIFGDTRFPRWFNAKDGSKPTDVWAELKKMNANFIHIPHQLADTSLSVVDWHHHDDTAQPLAEIFQVRGSYEHRGCPRQAGSSPRGDGHFLQDAWSQGVVIGVIASPDHGGGLGKAAVYATENTREAILDACRRRHTYGTTAAKIFMDVRVNGHLMGEQIEAEGKPVRITVSVAGTAPLEKVQICRSNKFIHTRECEGETCTFEWEDPDPLPGTSYYYVRVLQQSVQLPSQDPLPEIAWSSPVWVER